MSRLSSLEKLNRMVDLFTVQDEGQRRASAGKLNRGEVDAIAGFYEGLSESSKQKVKARIAEIYRDSSYHGGQKARFLDALERAGVPVAELEGVDGGSAEAFAKMSKEAQFERLQDLASEWGDEGYTREIRASSVSSGARTKIKQGIEGFKDELEAHHDGGDAGEIFWGGENYRAVYLEEGSNGRGKGLVGYTVELGIYDGHDIDRMLYFNRKGAYLGDVYTGE